VKPDLEGLPISKRQIHQLSGIDAEVLLRPSIETLMTLDLGPDVPWVFRHFSTIVAAFVALTHGWVSSQLGWGVTYQIFAFIIELAVAIALATSHPFLWLKYRLGPYILGLLKDIDRYNAVIKTIDINDRLEEAGNPQVKLENRDRVIEALYLTRDDLIRALKTERIMRKNRYFINRNPELFTNNLTALTALQVSDRATEHGRLLAEALNIALNTRQELAKLCDPRDRNLG
jgi:hypothetical protein